MLAVRNQSMLTTSGLAEIATLVGDPGRAAMLMALMDGRALTATELAGVGGVTPQTASAHLARMTRAGLLSVERQGRHRYHRLASIAVAQMLEGIMAVAATPPVFAGKRPRTGPRDEAMRHARTCYDHLAGQLAVAMADRMVERDHVELSNDGGVLTDEGAAFLTGIGVDLSSNATRIKRKQMFCRPCLDWSERRLHIAGTVGAAMLSACFANGWLRRIEGSRAIIVTPSGRLALDRAFGLPSELWVDR